MSIRSKCAVIVCLLFTLLAASACQTTQQALAKSEPDATQAALARGRFDLGCPSATAVVLSKDFIQPALGGAWAVGGIERLEYTVGIEGCDKRTTLVVICQEGTGTCFAANPNGPFRNNGYVHP